MFSLNYFRINDDTRFKTSLWSEQFTSTLRHYNPAYLGVTGPTHSGGNTAILTYDFTHRTHVDILGFYYPRHFTDWYADGWITRIYKKIDRLTKSPRIKLAHTMGRGSRYRVHKKLYQKAPLLINQSSTVLRNWKEYYANNSVLKRVAACSGVCKSKVVSFTFDKNNSIHTAGALRNVILAHRLLPGWIVRFYTDLDVLPPVLHQLLNTYKAEVVFVNKAAVSIPSEFWAYLVADDPKVGKFIVRNVLHRLSPRQTRLINDWQLSDHAYHTIRDRPWHSDMALVPDLFGAVRTHLINRLGKSMLNIISGVDGTNPISHANELLNGVLWPKIEKGVLSHDSTKSGKWRGSVPFSKLPYDVLKIGQEVNQYEVDIEHKATNT